MHLRCKIPTLICGCSRTSGSQLVRNEIDATLRVYKSPSDILAAPNEELELAINRLGLQEVRRKAVKMMSHDFFAKVYFALSPK